MPEATDGPTRPVREGWGVIRPGDRKAHFYRESFSLCKRVGFYRGPLETEDIEKESKDDCLQCRRALTKLLARRKRMQVMEGSK